jgi:hypothetical protein
LVAGAFDWSFSLGHLQIVLSESHKSNVSNGTNGAKLIDDTNVQIYGIVHSHLWRCSIGKDEFLWSFFSMCPNEGNGQGHHCSDLVNIFLAFVEILQRKTNFVNTNHGIFSIDKVASPCKSQRKESGTGCL